MFHRCGFYMTFLNLLPFLIINELIMVKRYNKWEGEDLKSEGQGKVANGGYTGNLLCYYVNLDRVYLGRGYLLWNHIR